MTDRTPLEATDHLGVVNRLWPVLDPRAHTAVQGLMGPRPIFIADGHHRYETGLRYRDDRAAAGALTGPDDPANFCLMMLVGMSDPGLVILPTHRLVSGFPGLTFEALAERLSPEFDVSDAGRGRRGLPRRLGGDRGRRRPGSARLRHGRRRPLDDGPAPLRREDGRARPRPLPRLAFAGREHPARAGAQGRCSARSGPRRAATSTSSTRSSATWRPGAATWPASCPPRAWITSSRSPRTWRRCPPRAPTSTPSSSAGSS